MPNVSAYAMAKRADGFAIGMGARESAKALRSLAKQVETGKVIPRRAIVQTMASETEFTASTLTFEYYEVPPCKPEGQTEGT